MCPKRAPRVMDQEDWRSGFFSVLLDIFQDQVRFSELVCIALLPTRHYDGYRSVLSPGCPLIETSTCVCGRNRIKKDLSTRETNDANEPERMPFCPATFPTVCSRLEAKNIYQSAHYTKCQNQSVSD